MSERPMVIAWVEGGIGYTAVVRGPVDILAWDWDVIEETDNPQDIRDAISEAEQLPDTWADKENILNTMRHHLEAFDA